MSRRHKETEITDNYKPQQADSQAEGSPKVKRSIFGGGLTLSNFSIVKRDGSKDGFLLSKIMNAISKAFTSKEIEVDDKWVKIPRSTFNELENGWLNQYRESNNPQPEEEPKTSKRGANPVKRLFKKIKDSKVMELFHKTLNTVKEKCYELYENITQFSICFLHGSHKAFAPDEDPYRKVSHYYDMIKYEVEDFPTRKTLSNYNYWFVNWKPLLTNESAKEKAERHRHILWVELIEWIFYYLAEIAPEYAVQPLKG